MKIFRLYIKYTLLFILLILASNERNLFLYELSTLP
jgi:hypothetical protein